MLCHCWFCAFGKVSSANLNVQVGFMVATQALPAAVFMLVGAGQMAVWAAAKHRRLQKVRLHVPPYLLRFMGWGRRTRGRCLISLPCRFSTDKTGSPSTRGAG